MKKIRFQFGLRSKKMVCMLAFAIAGLVFLLGLSVVVFRSVVHNGISDSAVVATVNNEPIL